jgi:hypothetical protein
MKKTLLILIVMANTLLHSTTQEETKRTVHEYLDLSVRRDKLELNREEWERLKQAGQEIEAFGFNAFPVYYEILEVNFDNPSTVSSVIAEFNRTDRHLASEGKKEALDWTRKVVNRYGRSLRNDGAAFMYLALKGNARDLDLLPRPSEINRWFEVLETRVAGINFVRLDDHWRILHVYPSVTNTGPQGVYVNEILQRAWIDTGVEAYRGSPNRYDSVTKIPPELLTMVVSFDKDGNPVCSVDLSKYGLSMPVIEPKPTANDPRGMHRTVTFPHDTEGWTPPNHEPEDGRGVSHTSKEIEPSEDDTPPSHPNYRPWLYIAIALLAVIGGVVVWQKSIRK